MTTLSIHHQEDLGRFSAQVDGHALELDYRRRDDQLIITHTGTAPALRGRGLAGELVLHVLQWLAPQALQLVPTCSYVASYLDRHTRWQRLRLPAAAQTVLNYWFGPLDSPTDQQIRTLWFQKSDSTDADIRTRFGPLLEQALAGGLRDWDESALGRLARIVVLDQFTRNSLRSSARAFAGDALALPAALALLDSADYASLQPLQRWFALLPLEHAEDRTTQQRSVSEFAALAAADARLAEALDYAHRHQHVIERFGRFPHRNALLGRVSSADELAYLAQPGAGF